MDALNFTKFAAESTQKIVMGILEHSLINLTLLLKKKKIIIIMIIIKKRAENSSPPLT
jgi:hypothetical protein